MKGRGTRRWFLVGWEAMGGVAGWPDVLRSMRDVGLYATALVAHVYRWR